jgi:hypothetical protein
MASTKKTDAGTEHEADQGFGESHGYSPSHGGPSGPGDAPADPKKAPKAPPDPSSSADDDAPLP